VLSGRLGITDAEMLQKKFMPTFDAEDLTKLPNFQTITSVMINGVPSAAFSMRLIPQMGKSNPMLLDALKKLSAAKYGRPRAQVEAEIFARLGAGDEAKKAKLATIKRMNQSGQVNQTGQLGIPGQTGANGGSSFLDEWMAKRQQIATDTKTNANKITNTTTDVNEVVLPKPKPVEVIKPLESVVPLPKNEHLHIRQNVNSDDEVSVRLR